MTSPADEWTADGGESLDESDGTLRELTQAHYDPATNGELSTAIVYAVAEAAGVEATELRSPLLYDAVDVAALESALFGPNTDGHSRRGVETVEFEFDGYLVRVRSDGWITVLEPG
ncbi:HalOD1 output domain-containing protein [Halorarum halobium]|uniref:HalOD1 output domain-containing protein n=1 Tax=Halorarum halobium TaxID=3075121 RepID=UPI0028B1EB00|nr:HalOD1 output domain-containing protein [Halobaculum sp. XH14]